jgi:hypothetical protein
MLSELNEKIRDSVQSDDLVRKFQAWKLPMSLTILSLVFGETISTLRSLPLLVLVFHNLTGRDPDSVMTFIYSVIALPTSKRTKLYQLQRFMLQSLGAGVFNATADGTEWCSDHRAVKCEISVRVLRWSFCPCLEFPDFHYLIMRVYCNFLSYLYYIPVFVL